MHEIRHLEFGARMTPKGLQKECDRIARTYGEYHHACEPIRFPNVVCKSYDEAYDWINEHDQGWYDCIAVKYTENRKTRWLVKIEYHI